MSVIKQSQWFLILFSLLVGCQKQDTCKTAANAPVTNPGTVAEPQCAPEFEDPVTGNSPNPSAKAVVGVSSFDAFANQLLEQNNPVAVLVISSPKNCGPCKTVDSYLPAVAESHSGKATYYLADPYEATEFMEFVTSLPTFFVLTRYSQQWDVVDAWEGANNQSFVETRVASHFKNTTARMAASRNLALPSSRAMAGGGVSGAKQSSPMAVVAISRQSEAMPKVTSSSNVTPSAELEEERPAVQNVPGSRPAVRQNVMRLQFALGQ